MTREEAIFCERSYIGETDCRECKYYGTDTCVSRESHRMAVEALSLEPCSDAISREAVLAMSDYVGETPTYSSPYAKLEEVVRVEDIKSLPSVQPKIKTGHWIVNKSGSYLGSRNGHCSNCKDFYSNDWNVMKFCPNCGAYMIEQPKEE